MKIKSLLSLAGILAVLLSFPTYVSGQENDDKIVPGKFGIGVHIEQFKITELAQQSGISSSNKLIFTFSPSSGFRLEPEIGFSSYKIKDLDRKNTSLNFGTGAFKMLQKGRTNFYGGLRLEYGKGTNESANFSTGAIEKDITNKFSVGPAIGAEYFFAQHFSFGGEINAKYIMLKEKEGNSGQELRQTLIATESGLIVRFYF